MEFWAWIVIVVMAIVVVGAVVWAVATKRRTSALRERFGSEYDRTEADAGVRRTAESELAERVNRRERLDIRPLASATVERYASEWQAVQARFVDDPGHALEEADRLVTAVMVERGYPMEDFEQRAADISVDHADMASNYRSAHQISLANDRGEASTEDMRTAMVHYRSLFDRLLETDTHGEPQEAGAEEKAAEEDQATRF